jgi:hypothetical protein
LAKAYIPARSPNDSISCPIWHNLVVCGRYRLYRRKQVVEEYFDCGSDEPDWTPRYNTAPTQPLPVIRQNPKEPVRELTLMRWGLIPSWAKDSTGAASMINARAETAATKPALRDALKSRRCLIPADGFYEWRVSSRLDSGLSRSCCLGCSSRLASRGRTILRALFFWIPTVVVSALGFAFVAMCTYLFVLSRHQ